MRKQSGNFYIVVICKILSVRKSFTAVMDEWTDGWDLMSLRTIPIITGEFGGCHTGSGVTDKGSFPPRHSILKQDQPVLALFL